MRMTSCLLIVLTCSPLLSCSSVPVHTDYDRTANFDKLQTYSWSPPSAEQEDRRSHKDPQVLSRIQAAIDRQLDRQGYQRVKENPDFLVTFHASTKERATRARPSRGHDRREQRLNRYEEGSLIVEILNPGTGNLMWQGVGTKVVDWQDDEETKTKAVNEAVQKILERFPPQN